VIRRSIEVSSERREKMRGGAGVGWARTYVAAGEMNGVAFITEMTIEPGSDIGLHAHKRDEKLYLVVSGHGTGLLDDEQFAVGPGDAWLCRAGHRHGARAGPHTPLRFVAVLTTAGSVSTSRS
jgi:mannose-6-phosphate isomerase-like protein (cupin superfamily)